MSNPIPFPASSFPFQPTPRPVGGLMAPLYSLRSGIPLHTSHNWLSVPSLLPFGRDEANYRCEGGDSVGAKGHKAREQ
jgi:hypothetical protein